MSVRGDLPAGLTTSKEGEQERTSDLPSTLDWKQVEMASLYARREANPVHEQWVRTFRTIIAEFRENAEELERSLVTFDSLDVSDEPNRSEYRKELRSFMHKIEEKQASCASKTLALAASLKQWETQWPEDVLCFCCHQSKTPSPLSCPSHHTLCLDCSAVKYLSKDLKCICDSLWSREQCESLHQALVANRPALVSSLPATPHRPIDEVQCQNCMRSVGFAALDSYICPVSHWICKKCAVKLSSCPACSHQPS